MLDSRTWHIHTLFLEQTPLCIPLTSNKHYKRYLVTEPEVEFIHQYEISLILGFSAL